MTYERYAVRKKSERTIEGDPEIAEGGRPGDDYGGDAGGGGAVLAAAEQPLGDRGGEETGIVGVLHQVGPRQRLQVGNGEGEQERRENGALGDAGENGPGCGKHPLYSNPERATPQEREEETDQVRRKTDGGEARDELGMQNGVECTGQVQEHHARVLPPGEPLHQQEFHTSNGVGGGMTGAETELVMWEQVKGVDLKKKAPVDDSLGDLGEDGEKRDRTVGGRCGKREGQGIREEGESDVTGQGGRSIIIVRGLQRQGGVGGGGEGGGEVGGDRLGPLRSPLRHPDRKSEGRDGGTDGTKATDVRPQRARGSGEGAEAPRLQSGPPPRDQPAAPPP
ncbi:uncharacterized protein LOC134539263 [Bacillus rossius redtenbacheri]|uniref:uncharacterized protein LOC134539263 n=1 Tax=Bacillus rossius redtenbacheri TaxID=93214 RepID=UPI002FDEB635